MSGFAVRTIRPVCKRPPGARPDGARGWLACVLAASAAFLSASVGDHPGLFSRHSDHRWPGFLQQKHTGGFRASLGVELVFDLEMPLSQLLLPLWNAPRVGQRVLASFSLFIKALLKSEKETVLSPELEVDEGFA